MKIECTVEEMKKLITNNKPLTDEEKKELLNYINKELAIKF